MSVGLVGFIAAVGLGYLGHVSETEQSYFGRRYFIDHYGRPHPVGKNHAEAPVDSSRGAVG